MHYNQMCRLCLVQTPICSSLLEDETKMLEALTSIKVNSWDGMSDLVCVKCRLNLKLAYTIQQKMIQANKSLVQLVGPIKIKIEHVTELSEESVEEVQISDSRCIICGSTTTSINSHIERHFKEEQYCDSCDKDFSDLDSYRKHLKNHSDEKLHHCTRCAAVFCYKSLYRVHREKFHRKPKIVISKPRIYKCAICSKISNSKSGHLHHVKNHKRRPCPICKKELAAGSLRQHLEDHMDSPKICEHCGATLKNKSCLRMHLRYSHNKEKFRCEECAKEFKKKISLRHHTTVAHGEAKFICDTCGKKFFTTRRLNIHKKMTHLKLRPHECNFCKKGFSSKFALTTHKRQHTNETPYRCEVCGEGFRQNVSLKGHKKSKHNIEEEKTCNCKVCGKGFASEWALRTHSRLH